MLPQLLQGFLGLHKLVPGILPRATRLLHLLTKHSDVGNFQHDHIRMHSRVSQCPSML